MHFHYLEDASIMYRTDELLTEFRMTPEWARERDQNRKRYGGALKDFLNRYVVTVDGGELLYEEFRERFLDWYRTLTDTKAPGAKEIGRVAP
jgi:hypothetical protein